MRYSSYEGHSCEQLHLVSNGLVQTAAHIAFSQNSASCVVVKCTQPFLWE